MRIAFGANAAEPSTHGRVLVLADNASGTSLTVYYEIDDVNSTASAGSDYQPLSGSVVLTPDMLWTAVIDVDPIDDAVAEGDERIVIRLKEDPNYVRHIWATSLTVILADDEQPPPLPRTYFVATTGSDDPPNDGTLAKPFKTLSKALSMARYGDTVYLREGVYRDPVYVEPTGFGFRNLPGLEASAGSWDHMLTIRNYNNEEVFIKGSDPVTGWRETSSPEPQMKLWQVPWTTRSQQAFVDGRLLGHVGWNAPLEAYPGGTVEANVTALSTLTNTAGVSVLEQTTAHMTNWSFYHDTNANLLYIGLPLGEDPNSKLVEVSTKMPFFISYDHIWVKGLKFRHSNVLPPTGGWPAVALHCYCILEDCDIQWCDFGGVSMHDQSRIINCLVANNGMIGGGGLGTNILVSGSRFLTNHYLPFDFRGEAAGSKIIGGPPYLDGCVWENNEFAYNAGQGLWFDSMTVRDIANPVIVRNNWFHDNSAGVGLILEVMNGIQVYNNLSIANRSGALYLGSASYTWVFNNTLVGTINTYSTLWFDGGYGGRVELPPHHLWITNNIIFSDETLPGPTDPQVVGIMVLGQCTGVREIFLDYNCWGVRGNRPAEDYFAIHSVDVYNGFTGPGCTVFETPYRTNWTGWQALGFDAHSLYLSDSSTIARLFINEAAGDYRISFESPAARAGLNLYSFLQNDYAYRPRPAADNFSIGAFEFIDTLSITATDASAAEAGLDPGTFTVTRQSVALSQPLTVTYAVSGSATPGTDYTTLPGTLTIPAGQVSAVIPVTPLSDTLSESTETVVVTLANDFVYAVKSPNSATVSILDLPTVPTVAVSVGANAAEPNSKGSFIITRTAGTPSSLTVFYSLGGTATSGADYSALSSSATIPANKSSVTVSVLPIDDAVYEENETVILTIQPNSNYTVSSQTATISLADNDPPPAPTGLTATAGNGQVNLTWNSAPSATSYRVRRATSSSGPFNPIDTVTTTSYRDSGLTNGRTYYYKVSARNAFGEGPASAAVSATPKS